MYRPLSVSGQSQLLRDRTGRLDRGPLKAYLPKVLVCEMVTQCVAGLLLARDVSSHLPTHQIDVLFRNCGSRRFRRGPQACEVIDDTALGASQLQLAQDRLAQEKQKNRNESPEYLSSTKVCPCNFLPIWKLPCVLICTCILVSVIIYLDSHAGDAERQGSSFLGPSKSQGLYPKQG